MGSIVLQNIEKIYPGNEQGGPDVVALKGVELKAANEEIVSLVGPSGCGKSTILNLIAGFEEPTSGEVTISGRPVNGAGPDRMVVFQTPALFPWLTVLENIVLGPKRRGIPSADYTPAADRFLNAVALSSFAHHYPYQLSGGMRQRTQIARALLNRPEVLLMDEPFGALDSQTRLSMQELLLKVWVDFRPTILFITHDVEEAVFLSDRIYVMCKRPGRIIEEIEIPFPKPRTFEILALAEFVEIKDRILHLIRKEMRQAFE